MFIDSHAHVDGSEFDLDRSEVLSRAREAAVDIILNVGTGNPHTGVLKRAVEFGESSDSLYTAIGVHPHDARHYGEDTEQLIKELTARSSKVIAWGEIGLDFHYDNSPRDIQMEVFKKQLQAAKQCGLPVIIHTREAEAETISILASEYGEGPGVFHCFSGTQELAEQALNMQFMISFSGILTFKKANELRAVARQIPLDRLLIETDCPYLAPVPHRGRRNEPAYVVEVARCLGELHGMEPREIGRITSDNFRRLFQVS
jgi:TatD DNase family protein